MFQITRIFFFLMSIISVFALSQCASYDFSRRVVQQGNLIPQEKVDRLRLGMSKQEVAILMGTSLLSPLFNNDRWDYAYTWRKGMGPMSKRYVVLYFKHNRLAQIDKNLEGKLHNTI